MPAALCLVSVTANFPPTASITWHLHPARPLCAADMTSAKILFSVCFYLPYLFFDICWIPYGFIREQAVEIWQEMRGEGDVDRHGTYVVSRKSAEHKADCSWTPVGDAAVRGWNLTMVPQYVFFLTMNCTRSVRSATPENPGEIVQYVMPIYE